MFPRLRSRPRPMRPLLALILGTWVLASRAANSDYDSDPKLAATMIDIAVHHSRPLSLAEVFSLVEIETEMNVTFAPGAIVLGDEVVLEKAEKISLSRLLASVAAQRSLVFERQDSELRVRSTVAPAPVAIEPRSRPRPVPMAATATRNKTPSPAPDPVIRVSPAPASVRAAEAAPMPALANQDGLIGELAGRIERIASGPGARSRKEKDIASAMRAAIAEVHVSAERKEQVLDLAVDLVQAAAGAAPQFTETIANAAAFAPAVARLKSAGTRLRAAAYAGMRAPQPRQERMQGGELSVERGVVIKAPRGETPETFVVPGAESVPEAAPSPGDDVAAAVRRISSLADSVQTDAPAAVVTTPGTDSVERADAAPAPTQRRTISLTGGSLPSEREESAAPGTIREGVTPFSAPALELSGAGVPVSATGSATGSTNNGSGEVIEMEKFSVSSGVVRGSAADLVSVQRRADIAVDYLSAEQISKFSAGDMAEIVLRIPGVSVAGGQFAVIRGLSDRYTNTTLNGLKIPSPDPEKQSPQLDLIPTSLVDSVVVSKSFAPYLWADTSGGSIDFSSASQPEERSLSFSYGLKVNSNATDGIPRYEIPDRKNDLLASGSKSRPAATPEEFRKPWDFVPQHDSAPLGQKFSVNYGDRFRLADRTIGLNLVAAYDISSSERMGEKQALLTGHTNDVRSLANSEYRTGTPKLLDGGNWNYLQSKVEVVATALANLGIELSDGHKLSAVGFWTRTGSDSVQINRSPLTTFTNIAPDGSVVKTLVGVDQGERRLGDFSLFGPQAHERRRDVQVYTERELKIYQLSGGHDFSAWGGLKLKWAAQQANTYQDEPNLVDARYYLQLGKNPDGAEYNFGIPIGDFGIPPSGFANINRFWGNSEEAQRTFRFDAEIPVFSLFGRDAKLRLGGAQEETDREHLGSNYTGIFHSLVTSQRTGQDPDKIFSNLVASDTPNSNRTVQSREVSAAFASLSLALPFNLELVGGARFERFAISTEGKDMVNRTPTGFLYHYSAFPVFGAEQFVSFGTNPALSQAHLTSVNFTEPAWYPSVGLVYRPSSSVTVRATGSRTSGRPSLREMGPYYNRSLESGEYVVGNPFLQSSEVTNLDTRVEWTPSRSNRFAVSFFTKTIKTPIEKVFLPGGVNGEGVETWSNNPNSADLVGAEFEFSQRLGAGFTLNGNLTWIKAEVEEHPAVVRKLRADLHLASDETVHRPLFDQPEYIANLDLTWAHPAWGTRISVAGYAISDVLESTGGGTVFGVSDSSLDIYDQAYHRVDLNFSQTLHRDLKMKFSVSNLTDALLGTIYDPARTPTKLTRNLYRAGRSYSLTLSKTF